MIFLWFLLIFFDVYWFFMIFFDLSLILAKVNWIWIWIWISLDLGALHQICPCLLLCGPYIKLPPQKSMRSLHKIGLIWCATQAWALSLPFLRKESSQHQKRNLLFRKFLECCFFVGEKEETWRTKKEPSKEKIREGKEEGKWVSRTQTPQSHTFHTWGVLLSIRYVSFLVKSKKTGQSAGVQALLLGWS